MSDWFVKPEKYPHFDPVIEVYESFNGDLYFVTEKDGDHLFGFVRLYSMPQFAEWGWFGSLDYLESEYGEHKIWSVDERNWSNLSSYEDDLLVEVSEAEA